MTNTPMTDEEYDAGLKALRRDWGELMQDPQSTGILRAANDPMTGILVGFRALLIAEIINRAIKERLK